MRLLLAIIWGIALVEFIYIVVCYIRIDRHDAINLVGLFKACQIRESMKGIKRN